MTTHVVASSPHALFSPSSAHRWMRCAGSVGLESREPDTSSEFADEGTAAHALAALALTNGTDTAAYLGWIITVTHEPAAIANTVTERDFTVDAEMAGHVQVYVDYVRTLGGELAVEQALPIAHITGEIYACGSADAVIVDGDVLTIIDLKYGQGVMVEAKDNPQLQIYALAAMREFDYLGDFNSVRVAIVQPRRQHISEWTYTPAELEAFRPRCADASTRGVLALKYFDKHAEMHEKYLEPGDSQCKFCKAKATCPALAAHVLATVSDDFVDVSQPIAPQLEPALARTFDNVTLGNLMSATDLIESWCKAVRAKGEAELLAGNAVPGFKLVQGRRGARKWADMTAAEQALKAMRLKVEEMYDLSLISPTTAEKLHKAGAIGPRQWPKLQTLVVQPEGRPSVAPDSDKRPALVVQASADEFDNVAELV